MAKKEVVIIGAGKMGRGYLAELFWSGGYHITFIVRRRAQADSLNNAGKYIVAQATEDGLGVDEITIDNYNALCFTDEWDTCVEAITKSNYVLLPIYQAASETAGHLLADAIEKRAKEKSEETLDVFLSVNYLESNKMLRGHIEEALTTEAGKVYYKNKVGIVETLPGRLAVDPDPELFARDENAVAVSHNRSFVCNADAFAGEVPEDVGAELLEKLPVCFEYKIWTTNMMHFGVSIYGAYFGYQYVHEAAADPYVVKCVRLAEKEAEIGVAHRYGMTVDELLERFYQDSWHTWSNPATNDGYARVVFDMRRKLSRPDRIIGPALACIKAGDLPYFLARIAALALWYYNPEDETSVELNALVEEKGIYAALNEFTSLDERITEERQLMQLIKQQYEELSARKERDLSLI